MKIIWTHESRSRLFEIEDFIAHDSPQAAAQFVQKLVDRANALVVFPNMGRQVPELQFNNYRELIEGNYRIIYRILKKQQVIEIVTVFEGRRLFPEKDQK